MSIRSIVAIALFLCLVPGADAEEPAVQVTIYSGGFASVKERRSLDLKKGVNETRIEGMTSQLEPDSVILRDLADRGGLYILEQNYVRNPLSQAAMLRAAEGKTLDFDVVAPQAGEHHIVKGLLIRADAADAAQVRYASALPRGDSIVQVDGKIQFGLPGNPLFNALEPGAFLKPTLLWQLESDRAGPQDVEIAYLTGGFTWEATYNFVAAGKGDLFDVTAWVTLDNESGKDFPAASVKLVAGEVARVPHESRRGYAGMAEMSMARMAAPPAVSERAFDEYHLYTLPRPTALLDREVKQVELLRATHISGKRSYVFDEQSTLNTPQYGSRQNSDTAKPVRTVIEIVNSKKNGLGMALPGGTVKAYRRDEDGRDELIGESQVPHTPVDETLRITTGNAFDIVGERKKTATENQPFSTSGNREEESYEIHLRNHKKEAVTVQCLEHLRPYSNWKIPESSLEFTKTDASTIQFDAPVPAGGETVVTYTVRYTN